MNHKNGPRQETGAGKDNSSISAMRGWYCAIIVTARDWEHDHGEFCKAKSSFREGTSRRGHRPRTATMGSVPSASMTSKTSLAGHP